MRLSKLSIVAGGLVALCAPASAQPTAAQSANAAALAEIRQTVLVICPAVSQTSATSNREAGARVDAALAGLARRVAKVDAGAYGRLQDASTRGVLQKDLATALRDTSTCRLQALQILSASLLPTPRRR